MSDDLTERLRDRRVCSPAQNSCRNDYICDLAADRIEELEAKLAKAREEGFWAGRSCGGAKKEIDAALAELKGQE